MPRGNGTGPWGYGPRTGRGLGLCGFSARGGAYVGNSLAYGIGRGLGFGRRFWPQNDQANDAIKSEITLLEQRLSALRDLVVEDEE